MSLKVKFFWVFSLFLFLMIGVKGCQSGEKREYTGSFYTNDSGESHGGFEWAGSYTAHLTVEGEKGNLVLDFSKGLGDPLSRHQFSVRDFVDLGNELNFRLQGYSVVLVKRDEDPIWSGEYTGYYIGNHTSKESEKVGKLSVEIFSGLRPHYYVELRLKSV